MDLSKAPAVLMLNMTDELRHKFVHALQKAFPECGIVPYSTYRKAAEHLPMYPKRNAFELVAIDVGGDPPFDLLAPASVSQWLEDSILSKTRKAVLVILCSGDPKVMSEWKSAIIGKTRQEFYDIVPRVYEEDDLASAVRGALKTPQRISRRSKILDWADPAQ